MQNRWLIGLLWILLSFQTAHAAPLTPLPPQPEGQIWPDDTWPSPLAGEGYGQQALDEAVARAFAEDALEVLQGIRAVVVIRGGGLAAEQYREGFGVETKLVSWSMGKSFTHALAGIMVGQDKIALDTPLPVPEWQKKSDDPRRAITLGHALAMSTGLAFSEDYVNLAASDVINMLYGGGYADMGHYAAAQPLIHEPGSHWSYSSGTTNMVSRVLRDLSGGTEETYRTFIDETLFDPIGITSAEPEFDGSGTFIGSSLLFMTARDYARFGLLYLRDGVWEDERILPVGWVDHGRRETLGSKGRYGNHFWLSQYADPPQVANAMQSFPPDTFMARGHEEQSIIIIPSKDVVIVCLSLIEGSDLSQVRDYLAQIAAIFPDVGASEASAD